MSYTSNYNKNIYPNRTDILPIETSLGYPQTARQR